MAFGTEGICLGCGQRFLVNLYNVKELCPYCVEEKAKKVREDHLQNIKRLTLEERLYMIEAFIYDYREMHRDAPPRCEMRY